MWGGAVILDTVRASVQKNSEFYRGAFGGDTFSVSKEACGFRHDFAKIPKFGCFTSKGTIYRVPEKVTFCVWKK